MKYAKLERNARQLVADVTSLLLALSDNANIRERLFTVLLNMHTLCLPCAWEVVQFLTAINIEELKDEKTRRDVAAAFRGLVIQLGQCESVGCPCNGQTWREFTEIVGQIVRLRKAVDYLRESM